MRLLPTCLAALRAANWCRAWRREGKDIVSPFSWRAFRIAAGRTARGLAGARALATFEDLGVQMSLHSTLSSYLEKLVWLLTGNFAKPGAQYAPSSLVNLAGSGLSGGGSLLLATA